MESIEGSIRVIAQERVRTDGGSIQQVLQFLFNTFGGNQGDYQYWRCSPTTFRIQLPHALSMPLVIDEGNLWGARTGWRLMKWDTNWDARFQNKNFRVRIKVTKFPEEFWHPFFIQQLAAQIGDLERTDEENIRGTNHMNLCLWVRCIDPKRIPYYMVLPFGNQWKECDIQVIA